MTVMKIEKVDGNEIGIWVGIAYIIWEDKGKTIYKTASGDEDDTFLSLNDCLKEIGYDGYGVCTVILEDWISGSVYQYGNSSDKAWYTHGKTVGFA